MKSKTLIENALETKPLFKNNLEALEYYEEVLKKEASAQGLTLSELFNKIENSRHYAEHSIAIFNCFQRVVALKMLVTCYGN